MRRFSWILMLFLPFMAQAQHLELGAMAGISNYGGDLAPKSFWDSFQETNAAFGGFLRYNFNNYFAAKFNVYHGKISGEDANAKNTSQQLRNLSFRSNILEFGLTVEYNILGYQPYALELPFSPYVFGGVAMFRFSPEAFYDGRWVELQPLGTEGQYLDSYPERDPYRLTTIAVPLGAGAKYAINDRWNLGLELGFRLTFTDYLDDVSTTYVDSEELLAQSGELAVILSNRSEEPKVDGDGRGDPNNKDWYFMGGITISYNFLDNGLVGSRGRNRRKAGCQTF
ncbi:MAG: DUF6089 family protein [Bacteroidota bacterium]